jgi:hypothetical protein
MQDKILARLQLDTVTGTWQAYVIANATTGEMQTVTTITRGCTLAYKSPVVQACSKTSVLAQRCYGSHW